MDGSNSETNFSGAKLALFIGDALLVYMRDDFNHIPFPGCWDFPGGGREGGESPETCALRETREEFGLLISPARITYRRFHALGDAALPAWFFVAHLPAETEARIRFGEEGQYWQLIDPKVYGAQPDAIPHLAKLLQDYLDDRTGGAT